MINIDQHQNHAKSCRNLQTRDVTSFYHALALINEVFLTVCRVPASFSRQHTRLHTATYLGL